MSLYLEKKIINVFPIKYKRRPLNSIFIPNNHFQDDTVSKVIYQLNLFLALLVTCFWVFEAFKEIKCNSIRDNRTMTALYCLSEFLCKHFKTFHYIRLWENLSSLGRGQFWPKGHHVKNLIRGPLDEATYQIWQL